MKIGLLVDGRAEYHALPHLLPRIASPHQIRAPLFCDIQPFANPAQIALAASKKFPILLAQGVESVVVLFDKETRPDCTVELAQAVERAAKARLADLTPRVSLQVVLKVSMLENWLVADPQALGELPGMFENAARIARQVSSGRADAVNALGLLQQCCKLTRYDKVDGAVAICKKLDPTRAAAGSRSFRKLLKTLGVEAPAPPPPRRNRRR
jgi:hypothetical protein